MTFKQLIETKTTSLKVPSLINFFDELIAEPSELETLKNSYEEIEIKRISLHFKGEKTGWELLNSKFFYRNHLREEPFLLINHNDKELFYNYDFSCLISHFIPSIGKKIYDKNMKVLKRDIEGYKLRNIQEIASLGNIIGRQVTKELYERHKSKILKTGHDVIASREEATRVADNTLENEDRQGLLAYLDGKTEILEMNSFFHVENHSWIRLIDMTEERCNSLMELIYDQDNIKQMYRDNFENNFENFTSECFNALRMETRNQALLRYLESEKDDYELRYTKALHEALKSYKKEPYKQFQAKIDNEWVECISTTPLYYTSVKKYKTYKPTDILEVKDKKETLFSKTTFDKGSQSHKTKIEPLISFFEETHTKTINKTTDALIKQTDNKKACHGQMAFNFF